MLKEQEHAGTLMLMAGEHKNKQSSTVPARRVSAAPRQHKKKKSKQTQIIIYLLKYIHYPTISLSFLSAPDTLWCNDS